MALQGTLVSNSNGERVIRTEVGDLRLKMGVLDYFLYGGKWDDFERRGCKLGWFNAYTVNSHVTGKQRKCRHNLVIWDEEQRLPTKLHAPARSRVTFCPDCGLGIAFKL